MLFRIPKGVLVAGMVTLGIIAAAGTHFVHAREVNNVRKAERSADLSVIFQKFSDCKRTNVPDACDGWREAYFALQYDQQTRDARKRLEAHYKRYPHTRPKQDAHGA